MTRKQIMRYVSGLMVIVLIAAGGAACAGQKAAKGVPVIQVKGPTIITHFKEISEEELNKGEGDAEAADDYSYYLYKAEKRFKASGIVLRSILGTRFRVKAGDKLLDFSDDEVGVGYYFIMPGKDAEAEKGVMTDEDLIETAQKYFGRKIE